MTRRILFAEDREDTRKVYSNILSKQGYEVVSVENGQKAWEVYQHTGFCGLLTNIGMPVMDGVELIKKIREDNPLFPVIAYTGDMCREDEIKNKGFRVLRLPMMIKEFMINVNEVFGEAK